MNILLWVLQVLLALHTVMGATWKFSHSAETVDSLHAIPHGVWLAMSVVEVLCSVALVLPAVRKRSSVVASIGAGFIAAEMLALCAVGLASGEPDYGHVIYWLIVAAVGAFIAWGRRAGATRSSQAVAG